MHGILGKTDCLVFQSPEDCTISSYTAIKITKSSLHCNCTYRYQFQLKKKNMHLSSSASSPITPRSVPKTSSRCSRLDNKNSNKHQTPYTLTKHITTQSLGLKPLDMMGLFFNSYLKQKKTAQLWGHPRSSHATKTGVKVRVSGCTS